MDEDLASSQLAAGFDDARMARQGRQPIVEQVHTVDQVHGPVPFTGNLGPVAVQHFTHRSVRHRHLCAGEQARQEHVAVLPVRLLLLVAKFYGGNLSKRPDPGLTCRTDYELTEIACQIPAQRAPVCFYVQTVSHCPLAAERYRARAVRSSPREYSGPAASGLPSSTARAKSASSCSNVLP